MQKKHFKYYALYSVAILSIISIIVLRWQQQELQISLAKVEQQCLQKMNKLVEYYESEISNLQNSGEHESVANISIQTSHVVFDGNRSYKNGAGVRRSSQLAHFSESLKEIVGRKYRFLLDGINLDAVHAEELFLLLMQREQVGMMILDAEKYGESSGISIVDVENLRLELKAIENNIGRALDADNAERFNLLKNSDNEQESFYQYALGINSLFPLDQKEQESVLFSRLRHKQSFNKALESFGFKSDYPLTKVQQEKLMKDVGMALNRYKNAFLQEVHGTLNHDSSPMNQYTMMENYTNTEFKRLLDKLRKQVLSRNKVN